jgi:Xaa-Pro aminopeptidase
LWTFYETVKVRSSLKKMVEDFKVPAGEINRRVQRIQKALQKEGIDGLFIVQRVDLFYFSGTAQNGFLYIPAEGEPLLFIKKYMPRARKETSIKNLVEIGSPKEVPGLLTDFYGRLPGVLGFESDVVPVKDYNFYRRLFPDQTWVDGSSLILKIRAIKSDWEIDMMERTAELSRKTFEHIQTIIRPGLTEMEFAGLIETFSRKLGHGGELRVRDYQTEGYPWHILSGRSGGLVGLLDSPASGEGTSAAFPCGGGRKKLAGNEPILIDFGTVLNGYHVDETRMFAIDAMPERALEACEAAIKIHDSVLERVRPGITVDELFQHAQSKAETLGYAEAYLGPPGYKVTFIGHGIGLELIEPPVIAKNRKDRLESGMTIALEPKIVFENEFMAGIESVFQVTTTGSRLISKVPVRIFIY